MKQKTIKPTFTPGPWKCYPVNPMQCNNNRTFEIHGFETEKSVRDVLPTEVEANAKLIAAAPDLLSVLLTIKELIDIDEERAIYDNNQEYAYHLRWLRERIEPVIQKATE